MKKYIIFDMDWTLIKSKSDSVRIIVNHLVNFYKIEKDKVKYIMTTTQWMPLIEQLKLIFDNDVKINYQKIRDEIYDLIISQDAVFFDWVVEKIKELKKSYKLFLSTGNSDAAAEKYLKQWWVYEDFELAYWSSTIPKWSEHIEIFKEYTGDPDFYDKTIYVWDWDSDRIFAREAGVDFIHIWDEKKDEYEISSVKDIDNIFKIINRKKWLIK